MTLDDLNLPEEETPETSAPVFTLDSLEEPAPAAPEASVFTLDNLDTPAQTPPVAEPLPEPIPIAEPIPAPIPEPTPEPIPEPVPAPIPEPIPAPKPEPAPTVHTTQRQPVYHSTPVQPVYHSAPVQPTYHAAPAPAPAAAPVAAPVTPKAEKAPKPRRRKPHIALRIPMQLLSFVLAVALFAVLISGALLADLRQITSEGGIKQIVNALLMPTANAPAVVHPAPIQVDLMDSDAEAGTAATLPGDITVDEDGNITIGGDVSINIGDIPDDILGGGGGEANVLNLTDYVYDLIDASTDKPLKFSKSEFQEFVQESTFSDYISEKLAGFADDFINDTENTRITSREILKLLKENEDLMESTLHVEANDQQWEQIEKTVDQVVKENDINATIREKVYTAVDNVLEENSEILGDFKREDLQASLQLLTSDSLFFGFVGAAAVVLLLLCLLNYYNVPAGLTWASIPAILAGVILSLPVLALQSATDAVMDLLPSVKPLIGVLTSFIGVFAPIHYGVLIGGFALLVVSIIWRIIRSVVRKNQVAV